MEPEEDGEEEEENLNEQVPRSASLSIAKELEEAEENKAQDGDEEEKEDHEEVERVRNKSAHKLEPQHV
mgnify:CR=1 FL=1